MIDRHMTLRRQEDRSCICAAASHLRVTDACFLGAEALRDVAEPTVQRRAGDGRPARCYRGANSTLPVNRPPT